MGLIRFLLAISVLIVHSDPIFGLRLLPGYLAVQSFYIISGFYMALIFNEKYSHTQRPLFYFYSNRFLRLYPLYLLVVLMTIGLSIVYGFALDDFGKFQYYINQYHNTPESTLALILLLISNIILIGQDIITFFSLNNCGHLIFNGLQSNIELQPYLFIPIAWTVSVELYFYLITPLVSKQKTLFVVGTIGAVLALRFLLFLFFNVGGDLTIYRFAPTELFWFLLGILVYKIDFLKGEFALSISLYLLVLMISILALYRFFEIDWIVLLFTALTTPAIFYRFSKNKIDRYLGELTYPLYISHCFFLLIIFANRFPKNLGTGIPLFAITLIFSVFVHRYFLMPIDKWREKRLN